MMLLSFSFLLLQGSAYGQESLLDLLTPANNYSQVQVMPDFDGDGFPDFLFSNSQLDSSGIINAGRARIFSSKSGALLFEATGQTAYEGLGSASLGIGDLDADGIADFLIASSNTTVTAYSSRTGMALSQLQNPWGLGRSSTKAILILADDLDLDGHLDYYYGAPNAIGSDGAIVAASSATGTVIWSRLGNPGIEFGRALDTVTDLDGDGVRDLLSCGNNSLECFSGVSGNLLWSKPITAPYQPTLATVDDLNGDAFEDFVYGRTWSDFVYVHSGVDGSLIRSISSHPNDNRFGLGLLRAGDLDGDGAGDFFVGCPLGWFRGRSGMVYLYSGGTGAQLSALIPPPGTKGFGWSEDLHAVGDWDGDGTDDFSSFSEDRSSGRSLLRIHRLVPPLQLTVTGSCPGNLTINVTGGSPFRAYGLAIGNGGSYIPSGGPLEELELGTGLPLYRAARRFDASGVDSFSLVGGAGLCGLALQAVEMQTRSTSATVTL